MWKEKHNEKEMVRVTENQGIAHPFKDDFKKKLNYALCPSIILFIQVPEDHEQYKNYISLTREVCPQFGSRPNCEPPKRNDPAWRRLETFFP